MKYALIYLAFIVLPFGFVVGEDGVQTPGVNKTTGQEPPVAVPCADIGGRIALVGDFGELGGQHVFTGRIVKTAKLPDKLIELVDVDGAVVPAKKWSSPNIADYEIGTVLKFEGREMGRLYTIGPLSNPDRKDLGRIGCTTFLEISKVLEVNRPK